MKNQEYLEKITEFVEEFSNISLSDLDTKLINEITGEDRNEKNGSTRPLQPRFITPTVRAHITLNASKISLT